jgi:hypothetical protein
MMASKPSPPPEREVQDGGCLFILVGAVMTWVGIFCLLIGMMQ